MPPSDASNVFAWLHLTDLHYGLKGQSPLWPNVRQAFYEDLARLHERTGPWNVVLFTGDLTQRGDAAEFERLELEVLEPLWSKLHEFGSKDTRLLAVPGNHDLVRPSDKPTAALRQLLRPGGFFEIADEFWDEPDCEYRRIIDTAFTHYDNWWKGTGLKGAIQSGLLPGDYSATVDIAGTSSVEPVRIGIIGLNTAFLQLAPGDYRGRLAWDTKQIHAICGGDVPKWIATHDASLLLTHHGPEWLDPRAADQATPEICPAGRFVVHLFGHMHENAVRTTSTAGGPPLRQWQCSSLFGLEQFGEPPAIQRRHGYGAGQIAVAGDGASIRHWPRHAFRDANGWRFERDSENCVLDEEDGGTRPDSLTHPQVHRTAPSARREGAQLRVGATAGQPNRRVVDASLPWPWPPEELALREYCEAVCKAHSHIQFVEIPYLKDVSDVEMDNLYVEPRFSSQELHPDIPPTQWPRRVEALDALTRHMNLVLLGDPGSGKSTLVSCLSWQLCRPFRASANAWAQQLGGMVPFPIVLRELHLKADLTWERLLDAFLEHPIGTLLHTRKFAESILKQGRGLILLDGLDEIGALSVRRKLRDAVHAGMALYPTSRWILTSRVVGYDQVPFHIKVENVSTIATTRPGEIVEGTSGKKRVRSTVADKLFLAPFDDEQVSRFSLNWYRQHDKDEITIQNHVKDFVQAIRENEGTQRLARIPYLLTLMALIHHKNARLPYGRTELYERIATAYLESIDLRRQLDQLPYSLAQKKRWLADVAFRMQLRRDKPGRGLRQGAILASKAELQRWLRNAMADSGASNSKEESEGLIKYFAVRSGLLLPRGESRFAFMHLSLQEYFAACFLEPRLTASRFAARRESKEPSDEQLWRWANSGAWSEAFILLFELMSEKSQEETEGLLDHIFKGRLRGRKGVGEATAAGLLAELATDPFVLLAADRRRRMRQQCWRWVFGSRNREAISDSFGNKIVRTLIRDSGGDLSQAWKAASLGEAELANVEVLDFTGCPTLSDLSPLSKLRRLKALILDGCTGVSDLTPLAKLTNLVTLHLDECTSIIDLGPLRKARSLQSLSLGRSGLDLTPLSELPLLADLHFHSAQPETTDLSPLVGLENLVNVCSGAGGWALLTETLRKQNLTNVRSPGIRRLLSDGKRRPSRLVPVRK